MLAPRLQRPGEVAQLAVHRPLGVHVSSRHAPVVVHGVEAALARAVGPAAPPLAEVLDRGPEPPVLHHQRVLVHPAFEGVALAHRQPEEGGGEVAQQRADQSRLARRVEAWSVAQRGDLGLGLGVVEPGTGRRRSRQLAEPLDVDVQLVPEAPRHRRVGARVVGLVQVRGQQRQGADHLAAVAVDPGAQHVEVGHVGPDAQLGAQRVGGGEHPPQPGVARRLHHVLGRHQQVRRVLHPLDLDHQLVVAGRELDPSHLEPPPLPGPPVGLDPAHHGVVVERPRPAQDVAVLGAHLEPGRRRLVPLGQADRDREGAHADHRGHRAQRPGDLLDDVAAQRPGHVVEGGHRRAHGAEDGQDRLDRRGVPVAPDVPVAPLDPQRPGVGEQLGDAMVRAHLGPRSCQLIACRFIACRFIACRRAPRRCRAGGSAPSRAGGSGRSEARRAPSRARTR